MTRRERFLQTLTFGQPDRPASADYFFYPATRERWEREGSSDRDAKRITVSELRGMASAAGVDPYAPVVSTVPGQVAAAENAAAIIGSIRLATELAMAGRVGAVVTAS